MTTSIAEVYELGGILVFLIGAAWRGGGKLSRIETDIKNIKENSDKADVRMDRFEKRQGELIQRQGRMTDVAVAAAERQVGVENHVGEPSP